MVEYRVYGENELGVFCRSLDGFNHVLIFDFTIPLKYADILLVDTSNNKIVKLNQKDVDVDVYGDDLGSFCL